MAEPPIGSAAVGGNASNSARVADLILRNRETSLRSDDGILVYTDGATDVRREGKLLGLDGLIRLLAPMTTSSAGEIVSQVERAILDWAEKPIRDDLCVLVLKPR